MGELRDRLERLASRGTARGAVRVWDEATVDRPRRGQRVGYGPAFAGSLAVVALVAVLASSLIGGDTDRRDRFGTLIAADRLAPFADCDELLVYLKDEARSTVSPYGLGSGGSSARFAMENGPGVRSSTEDLASAEIGDAPASDGPSTSATDGSDVSGTNIQEAGVDEPDTVKTDGEVVYALAQGRLWALDARRDHEVLDSLPLESASSLLLVGDRLVAFGGGGYGVPFVGRPEPMFERGAVSDMSIAPAGWGTVITVIDVSRPEALTVVTEQSLESGFVSARLVDMAVQVVLSAPSPQLAFVYPQSESGMSRAERANVEVLEESTLADWLPGDATVDCENTYRPTEGSGTGLVTVLRFDPAAPTFDQTATVVGDGQLVYASTEHLFVASPRWEVDEDAPTGRMVTVVHQFDATTDGPPRYLVSGRVRGTPLNQFSFSEHEGHLRVATTDQNWSTGDESESFVTVLRDDGDALVEVGQVGELGPTEQIYAVRFIGDKGYVVTFRQTDPLYVVDLSDPTAPRVTGELKILGYSAYLHPVGDGLLVGVGQDATEQGRTIGTQVALYDVRDPANPTRLHQVTLTGGFSSVEYDHHAFLHWPATGLTVVPVTTYHRLTGQSASEAIGYRIGVDGIVEVGRVAHPTTALPAERGFPWQPSIERTLVVGERLLTVSQGGLMASDLATLAELDWTPFA